ncbi:HTH-type transcriptional regulator Cbl [Hafnia alvei]|uniref:HTH-type transcriptional regulator Cbl n=1 Tax=Hafnia alvei TaxID=569 RepID=UPI0011EC0E1F|nr:HTH-type transcriptional regulator Cbl [Hafnia alvei]KAA0263864.1 HTH-type transcriptional regulator Cbl [Hafnia alvei]
MNFQQLKIIRESARCNFNLTEVASMLYTSQSGVSRHIRELEDELGLDIFVRHGKRILGLTEPGKALLTVVERTLDEASNIRRIAEDFTQQSSGILVIATTHTQARYSLPLVLKNFRQRFPQVRLVLNQGSPQEIRTMLHNGDADIGIASECLTESPAIAAFPWFNWQHALLVPRTHPLVELPITLENVSQFPLITYRQGITGRSRIDKAFSAAGLAPDIVLSAQDSDVVKTYVELGFGVGILAEQACQRLETHQLVTLDASALFAPNTAWIGVRKGQIQRDYVWQLIELCNPALTPAQIKTQVMQFEDPSVIDYQI